MTQKTKRWLDILDDILYYLIDIGVDDLDRAAQNRQMVANKEHTQGYLEVEDYLRRSHKKSGRLPDWMIGSLPHVGKKDRLPFTIPFHEKEETED